MREVLETSPILVKVLSMKNITPLLCLLCSCSMPNPWFILKSDGSHGGEDSSRPETGTGTSNDSTGYSSTSEESSAATRSEETTPTTGSTSISTTEGIGTSSTNTFPTSGWGTGTDDTNSSTTGTTETMDTMGTSGTTGGEVGMIYWDLYVLCPAAGVQWLGGKSLNIAMECNGNSDPYVGQIPKIKINGKDQTSVLNFSPTYVELGGRLKGDYPLILTVQEAETARLKTAVHCPVSPQPNQPCDVHVKLAVEVNKVEVAFVEADVMDGETVSLQLDLFTIPSVVEGLGFNAVLYADVGGVDSPNDHAYFIHPRIYGL